jgi:hypothetical protein
VRRNPGAVPGGSFPGGDGRPESRPASSVRARLSCVEQHPLGVGPLAVKHTQEQPEPRPPTADTTTTPGSTTAMSSLDPAGNNTASASEAETDSRPLPSLAPGKHHHPQRARQLRRKPPRRQQRGDSNVTSKGGAYLLLGLVLI